MHAASSRQTVLKICDQHMDATAARIRQSRGTSTGQIPGQDGSGLHGTAQNGDPRQRFWRPERLPAVKICRLSTIILEGYVVGSSTVLLVNLHITYRRTMHTRSMIFISKNTRKRLTAGLRPGTLRALKRSPCRHAAKRQ